MVNGEWLTLNGVNHSPSTINRYFFMQIKRGLSNFQNWFPVRLSISLRKLLFFNKTIDFFDGFKNCFIEKLKIRF